MFMYNTIRQKLIMILLILPGITVLAQEKKEVIHWYGFQEAYQLNKKKPRLMFVDVYTDWCGYCKKMDKETFQDPEIAKYMQKHFYCVKLNAETKDTIVIDSVKFVNTNPKGRGGNNRLAVELLRGKMSYPSFVFLNEQNQVLTVVPGYMDPSTFEPVLHYFAEKAYRDVKWEDYRNSFAARKNNGSQQEKKQ
jgi:thioredoxin-related protein